MRLAQIQHHAMKLSSINCDGLWRWICPSLNPVITTGGKILSPRIRSRQSPPVVCCSRSYIWPANTHAPPPQPPAQIGKGPQFLPDDTVSQSLRRLTKCPAGEITELARYVSDRILYVALGEVAGQPDGYDKVVALVHYMVRQRKSKPHVVLYEALTKVMRDVKGSARALRIMLEEVKALGLPRAEVLRNALVALTIHPDYLLRNEVLQSMQEDWITLTMSDHEAIALGLLRDGQFELAFEKLDSMFGLEDKLRTRVSPLILEIFLTAFTQAFFLDEALSLLLHRLRSDYATLPANSLFYLVLDAASRRYHYAGVKYVWDRTERAAELHVPDGMLGDVLATATRFGDAKMATEAVEEMSVRGARIAAPHYEALVDLHASQGRIEDAMRMLCIMSRAGISPGRESTRSLYIALRGNHELPDKGVEILSRLVAEYGTVPPAASNVLIEAAVEASGIDKAIVVYRAVERVFPALTIDTFMPLVFHASEPETLAALAADFIDSAVADPTPASSFYDKLVWGCAKSRRLDHAFHLLTRFRGLEPPRSANPGAAAGFDFESADNTWWMEKYSILPLLECALDAGDGRAVELLEALDSGPDNVREAADRIRSEHEERKKDDEKEEEEEGPANTWDPAADNLHVPTELPEQLTDSRGPPGNDTKPVETR